MTKHHSVTTLADLPPGTARAFEIAGRKIALFNVDGRVFATDDTCTHAEASLADGELSGTTITCPWHGAEFDVTCGKALCPPAVESLRSYPVFINGDTIGVEI